VSIAPSKIVHHQQSRRLEVGFADGTHFDLPCEYLRVFSPSAEVRGHGPAPRAGEPYEPLLVGGKRAVNIAAIEPVGRYAVRLRFDDGHDTGLYTWDGLRELGANQNSWWPRYLERLAEHGMSRDSDITKLSALGIKTFKPATGKARVKE
jgi:DUF971 family protein